jgi:hypothetical protein
MRDLVLKPGAALPGWKEAFRSAWQNQSPDKVFASNRAFCKECRQPMWIGASGREGRGEHEHKPVPWGPQQVTFSFLAFLRSRNYESVRYNSSPCENANLRFLNQFTLYNVNLRLRCKVEELM